MTTSHLPRRAFVGAVLATTLIGAGLAAFADDAPAGGPCPSWTDPAGDSTTGQEPTGTATDDQMDIVGVSLSNDGANIVAAIKVKKLGDTASDWGDEYHVNFTLGGKEMQVYTDRGASLGDPLTSPVGFDSGFYNITDDTSGAAKSVYDVKTSTVTITGTVAELSKALGSDATGKIATALVAESQDYLPSPVSSGFLYDDAATKQTFTVGADCAGGSGAAPVPAPVPSATPSSEPAPSAAPGAGAPAQAGLPAAGCNTFVDAKGDGSTGSTEPTGGAPNDPDLDITGVVFGTTEKAVTSIIRVDKLADAPSPGIGDYWIVDFSAKGKDVEFASNRLVEPINTVHGTAFAHAVVRIGGTTDKTIKLTATYDTKNSLVILSADRAALEKVLGGPLAGAELSKLHAESGFHVFTGYETADVADAKSGENFVVDSNPCFAPPTPPLSSVGAVKAQYGDVAAVAAKLVDAAGAAVAGKTVTFTLGSSKATGTTGADGIAKAALLVKEKAGKLSLVITSDDAKVSVDFTVSVEKTVLKAVGGKAGVTATLTDDDKKPVAGQVITFASGSKKVTAKTDAKGVAKATGLPPGNIKVTYAGAAGMYTAASTTTKA